ncbi:SSU ribosomal protein S9P [Calocera cornea HHB12733]|uniref:SSU ribosomal protein S9P n=1 Tax=Calocera cornea HHB12733 TaxID=1353952 RepID=A0A165E9X7_9BASI|nr:SSU ribosomal protein S9P [Calocera cornea HHB12733]
MACRRALASSSRLIQRSHISRHYATGSTFIPPQAVEQGIEREGGRGDVAGGGARWPKDRKKYIPASPHFYTAREAYYRTLYELESLERQAKRELEQSSLLPAPKAILERIRRPEWMSQAAFKSEAGLSMGMSMRKRLIAVLDQMTIWRGVARQAGLDHIAVTLTTALQFYGEPDGGQKAMRTGQHFHELDQYGRSYAHGARKTSSARVWMIATDPSLPTARPSEYDCLSGSDATALVDPTSSSPAPPKLLTSTILVNSMPLATYFNLYDREKIIRPLRLTGLLGAFNVFAIARGGGTSGQADAVAVALGRAIMSHAPEMKGVLSQAGLLHRDPRMVERKKPGQPKARKQFVWVKR